MKRTFYRACIELTNRKFTAKLLRAFAQSSSSKFFVRSFARTFHIDEAEMSKPLSEYRSLHEFFIRELREGVRPLAEGEDIVISPVDGVVAEYGELADGVTFTVKGQLYTIEEMLGDKQWAERYNNGVFIVLYLSPSHYHRIHSPLTGEIVSTASLGERSYPVNHLGLTYGKRPLSLNYRVISEMSVQKHRMAVVKVGAMNVNTIELTYQQETVRKGEELGYFSFGSTVVLLFGKGLIDVDSIVPHGEIKMGAELARLNHT